jgi:hypothetical protein
MKALMVKIGKNEVRPLRAVLVRWLDEDRGWRNLVVAAVSEEAARDSVEDILGFVPLETRVIGATVHAG